MVCGYGPGVNPGNLFYTKKAGSWHPSHRRPCIFFTLLHFWGFGWGGVITFFPLRSSHDVLGFLGCWPSFGWGLGGMGSGNNILSSTFSHGVLDSTLWAFYISCYYITLFHSTLLMFLHILWLRSWYYVMDVLTYRYYVIDSTLLMLILVTLCVLDVLTYLAALFAETPAFVDCKVTKCIRKKIVCFSLSWLKMFKC